MSWKLFILEKEDNLAVGRIHKEYLSGSILKKKRGGGGVEQVLKPKNKFLLSKKQNVNQFGMNPYYAGHIELQLYHCLC